MSILSRRLLPLSLTHPACLARASPRRAHSAMVAGPARTAMEEVAKGGEFVRSESVHRNWVKQGARNPGRIARQDCSYSMILSMTNHRTSHLGL